MLPPACRTAERERPCRVGSRVVNNEGPAEPIDAGDPGRQSWVRGAEIVPQIPLGDL